MMEATETRNWENVRCPAKYRVLFFRQLSIMVNAGIPLFNSLEVLAEQPEHPLFGSVVEELSHRISSGQTLSSSMKMFPKVFNTISVSLVAMGERTGQLPEALAQLADWSERDENNVRKLKSALTYPAFVMTLAVTLMIILFLTVIPGFIDMFEERGLELPLLTKIVAGITRSLTSPGYWLIVVAVAINVYTLFHGILKTEKGRVWLFSILVSVPVLGKLFLCAGYVRFAGVLATLLESGADLIVSLKIASSASASPIIQEDEKRLAEDVQDGLALSEALAAKPGIYPSLMPQMVAIGEESSRISAVMLRVAAYYEEEFNESVKALGIVIEPAVMVLVSFVVGTVVLAIIMPLYSYLNQLGA